MACNRHKRKENGEVKPVLRGLAQEVEAELGRCGEITSVSFRFISRHQGNSKVRLNTSGEAELTIVVCDNEHGKQQLTVKTPEPFAISRTLTRRLRRKGTTVDMK